MMIFDILRDILRDKTGNMDSDPEFKNVFSGYMINRFLSMHEEKEIRDVALKAASLGLHEMGDVEYYKYLVSAVPRTGKTFIRYIKKPEKSSAKSKSEKPKKPLPPPRPS